MRNMSRKWFNKICYAFGILCFLTGLGVCSLQVTIQQV
jgi:hypothetical protein